MIYSMRCDVCKKVLDVGVPVNMHESFIKPGIRCNDGIETGCVGMMNQIIMPPAFIINRSAFPGRGNEVALPTAHGEDVRFRDKSEARDWLGERGLTSKWIENDM
jgi:hypothetical protein